MEINLLEDFDLDEYQDVESSHISGIGYRNEWLVVVFKKGSIYRYRDCASQFFDIISAESIGKYFHQNIKNMPCEKISITTGWPE